LKNGAEPLSTPLEHSRPILIVGGTGKTGRRVAERLAAKEIPVRIGSRSASPCFNWENAATWALALEGVSAAYITYYPDLAVPGAAEAVEALVKLALSRGVRRLVLLSGRGEPEAQRCERMLMESGADWTILRCSWFSQNFSENYLVDSVVAGDVILPAGDVGEPFVDADDIADAAVAALTEEGHVGQLYELTGPRLLTFEQAVGEIAAATGRDIAYHRVSYEDFEAGLAGANVPGEFVWLLKQLFTVVLDGRNEHLTDGIQSALGRAPKDFASYIRDTAATGIWSN
jgi:uncharacterized protein YbjT (DUF2867 family)